MRLSGKIIGIAVLVAVLGTSQTLFAQPLLIGAKAGLAAGGPGTMAGPSLYEFNLSACQQDCRSRYGVDPYADEEGMSPYRRGGSGGGMYELYAQCIQDCNERFWRDYDRKMRDLERE